MAPGCRQQHRQVGSRRSLCSSALRLWRLAFIDPSMSTAPGEPMISWVVLVCGDELRAALASYRRAAIPGRSFSACRVRLSELEAENRGVDVKLQVEMAVACSSRVSEDFNQTRVLSAGGIPLRSG